MLKVKKETFLHNLFIIGIIIKGIDGILELISGFILISIKSNSITKIIQIIFQHKIAQDPTDLMLIISFNYLITYQ